MPKSKKKNQVEPAGEVDMRAGTAESKEKLVQHILQLKKQADDATNERRKIWDELWQLYQNKQDFTKKQSWQSKAFIPKIFMAVLRASSIVKRGVLQTPKLFKFILDDDAIDEQMEKALQNMGIMVDVAEMQENTAMRIRLDTAKSKESARIARSERRFKQFLDRSNFVQAYSEMIQAAFLLGIGWLKLIWEKNKLIFQHIAASKVFVDPNYRPFQDEKPGYLIEVDEKSLTKLKLLAKEVNKSAGSTIFDEKAIADIEEDWRRVEEEQEEHTQTGVSDYTPVTKRVNLLYFWGDVIDDATGSIQRDQLVWIANEKYIIRHQDNPYSFRRPPYVATFPIPYPHRGVAGVSLVEPMVKLQYTFNNIVNMYVDNLNFTVNKIYECNTHNLSHAETLSLIYPGKIIRKTSDVPALSEVYKTPITDDALKALNMLDQEIQAGTAVTEFIQGMAGENKTATETKLKTESSQGLFDVIGRDIEINSIKPTLEMARDMVMQYHQTLGKDMQGDYDISVGGISVMLMQDKMREAIMVILALATKTPLLAQMTDLSRLWEKFLGVFDMEDAYKKDMTMMDPVQRAQAVAKAMVQGMNPQEVDQAAMSMGMQPAAQPMPTAQPMGAQPMGAMQ